MKGSTSLEGQFLVAMPGMGDTRFEKTVIYICAHSEEGAMGFVVNRPAASPSASDFLLQLGLISETEVNDLPEHLGSHLLHTGGPVEPGRGFVLHTADYSADATLVVDGQIGLTATLEILRELATGSGPSEYLVTLGYSGWSAGQLEEEIAANGWLVCPADSSIIFSRDDEQKYARAMGILGIDPNWLSAEAGHA